MLLRCFKKIRRKLFDYFPHIKTIKPIISEMEGAFVIHIPQRHSHLSPRVSPFHSQSFYDSVYHQLEIYSRLWLTNNLNSMNGFPKEMGIMLNDALRVVEDYNEFFNLNKSNTSRRQYLPLFLKKPLLLKEEGKRQFFVIYEEEYWKAVEWERNLRELTNRPELRNLRNLSSFLMSFISFMKDSTSKDADPVLWEFSRDISELCATLILTELSSGIITSNMSEEGISAQIQSLQHYQPKLWYKVHTLVQNNPTLKLSPYMRMRFNRQRDQQTTLEDFLKDWLHSNIGKYSEAFFGQYPELAVQDYEEFQSLSEGKTRQLLSTQFVEALSSILDNIKLPGNLLPIIGQNKKDQIQSIYQILARCTQYQEGAMIPLVDVIGPIPPGNDPGNYLQQLNSLLDCYHAIFDGLLKKQVPFVLYYPNLRVFHKTAQIQELLKSVSTVYGCPNCGAPLERNSKTCPQCHTTQENCIICRAPIAFGEAVGRCYKCETNFHSHHLFEWIKLQRTCPKCQNSLSPDQIQVFTIGLGKKK